MHFQNLISSCCDLLNVLGKRIVFRLFQHEIEVKPTLQRVLLVELTHCSNRVCVWESSPPRSVRGSRREQKSPRILPCDGHRAPRRGLEVREEALLSACSSHPNSPFAARFRLSEGKNPFVCHRFLQAPAICRALAFTSSPALV